MTIDARTAHRDDDRNDDWIEPEIIMNGQRLTKAQAMTVRCAIESYSFSLAEPGSLGTDEHGVFMRDAYLKRISEIRPAMYANNPHYVK